MEKNTALENLTELRREALKLRYRTEDAVKEARKNGASWTEVAESLGVSKQAAAKKYGELERQEARSLQWEQENPEKAAAIKANATAETQQWINDMHERLLAEAAPETRPTLRAMWNMPNEDTEPATPSIFVDPLAPAKKESALKKAMREHHEEYYDPRPAFFLAQQATAQPGTGKGPHACPKCDSTNHKGSIDEVRAYPECRPTKYDPQDITDWLNARS